MKIYHFSSVLEGGGGNALVDIYESIKKHGANQKIFYNITPERPINSNPDFIQKKIHLPSNGYSRIKNSIKAKYLSFKRKKYLSSINKSYSLFSNFHNYYDTPLNLFGPPPDIIHLHWTFDWLNFESFFSSLPHDIPVVITLHDMNYFTGGCHYSRDCINYETNCFPCPAFMHKKGKLASTNLKKKAKAFSNINLHIVCNSSWMKTCASNSIVLKTVSSIRTIYYGIDDIFFDKPDKFYLRRKYQIPEDSFIISFGASDISNPDKGFVILLDALNILRQQHIKFTCVVFGGDSQQLCLDNIIGIGQITEKKTLRDIYASSDLFVLPSLYEAFGLVGVESMAAATAVLGSATGGITDYIKDEVTGFLFPVGNTNVLADKIQYIISNPKQKAEVEANASSYVKKHYNKTVTGEGYYNLYKSIL